MANVPSADVVTGDNDAGSLSSPRERLASRGSSRSSRPGSPRDLETHLKPHIAVAPPHSELLLTFQTLVLEKSDVVRGPSGGEAGTQSSATATATAVATTTATRAAPSRLPTLDLGSLNPFFLHQRYGAELRSLQGPGQLMYDAFMARDLEKLEMLLSHGFALPNAVLLGGEDAGWTGLMAATRFGWRDVVELLLAHGASPLRARPRDQLTPLFLAVTSQNVELVDLLLDWSPPGAALDAALFAHRQMAHTLSTSTRENVLMFAARKGFFQVRPSFVVRCSQSDQLLT